jgi:hypothetical protein
MPTNPIPEPLQSLLRTTFDVDLFWHSFPDLIHSALASDAQQAALFKQQFASAIIEGTISPGQYYELTNHRFESEEDLHSWLRKLWREIYGDEPIPGDE